MPSTQPWLPYRLASGEPTGFYHYAWCREHWTLVLTGTPKLRRPEGQEMMAIRDIVSAEAEAEAGAHRFLTMSMSPPGCGFARPPNCCVGHG